MTTTRESMIDTMCQLLRRQGVSATGVQQVIDESGAPRGSLYHHFPGGKAELVAEAIRRSGERGAEQIEQLATTTAGPREMVGRFIEDFTASLTSSAYADGCPVATVALEVAATADDTADAVASAFTAWITAFARALQVQGLHHEDATNVGIDVLAHVEGALLLSKALRSTHPLDLARVSIDAQLSGLGLAS